MTEDENINKRYWNMGEVATLLNLTPTTLRYWCKVFGFELLRGLNQKRKFNQADIDKLSAIKSYVAEGYKLRAIKNKI